MDISKIVAGLRMIADGLESSNDNAAIATGATARPPRAAAKIERIAEEVKDAPAPAPDAQPVAQAYFLQVVNHNKPAVKALLAEFGATSLSTLDKAKHPAFGARLAAILSEPGVA